MGKYYHHFTTQDRVQLYELLFAGESIAEIARQLGFHKASIYRELERNSSRQGYRPDWAAQQYLARKFNHAFKLDKNSELKEFVVARLKERWSPQQIAGRLKRAAGRCVISHEAIYSYVYSESGKAQQLYQLLHKKRRFRYPRIRRKRQKSKLEAEKIGISKRSDEINQRQTFGHWEGDLLLFGKQPSHLITLRERKSRLIAAIKNDTRKPDKTAHTLTSYMKKHFDHQVVSLTLDNDIAFIHHPTMAHSMNAQVYFCEPYKCWQKGAIENANRALRTYLPKKSTVDHHTQEEIENIVKQLNNRPMRCLDYRTPQEAFEEYSGIFATARAIRT